MKNIKNLILIPILAILAMFAGCKTPQEFRAEADKDVYDIIDSKWKPGYGSKTNYQIKPIEPNDPNITVPVVIDPNEAVIGIINLPKAVAIATKSNRDYISQKENLYLQALTLTGVRHNFERQWFGTVDASYFNSGEDGEEGLNAGGAFGFSQLLKSGTLITADIALDWTRFLTGSPRESLGSVIRGSIDQPLLRGAGYEIITEGLTQAERDVLYEIRSFNRFRQDFVVSIVNSYYSVLQQRDQVDNALNNYNRRVDSQKRLEMLAQAGRAPQFEVDQAQQSVLSAEDAYVAAQRRYQESLDNFKIRLALPADANIVLDQKDLEALYAMGIEEPGYQLDSAVQTALLNRLDLANVADSVDDAVRKIIVAENNLEADLNLFADYNVGSQGDRNFTSFNFNDSRYTAGVQLDLPLDRLRERNFYRTALINFDRAQRQYEQEYDLVILDVREADRRLRESIDSYRIRQNSLELAQRRVESTTLLLEAGRLTTRDVLESQDDLVQAENDLTASLVGHLIAKLNFYKDIGVLEVRPDGMWDIEKSASTKIIDALKEGDSNINAEGNG